MKKKILAYILVSITILSLFSLAACSPSLTGSDPVKQNASSESIESSKSEVPANSELSSSGQEEKDYVALYSETLSKIVSDSQRVATHYAFLDIDGNGTKELITAIQKNSEIILVGAYYLKKDVSTYLADGTTAAVGGRRAAFQINQDGTVSQIEISSGTGKGTLTLYRLRGDNSGLDIVQEVTIEKLQPTQEIASNENPIDLTTLDWQMLDLRQTETTTKRKLDIMAVGQGDLSSIAGTYTGLNGGNRFTFNADGTGSASSSNAEWSVRYINFRVEDGMAVFNAEGQPTVYYIIPAGVDSPNSSLIAQWDDSTRDRVYVSGSGVNIFFLD